MANTSLSYSTNSTAVSGTSNWLSYDKKAAAERPKSRSSEPSGKETASSDRAKTAKENNAVNRLELAHLYYCFKKELDLTRQEKSGCNNNMEPLFNTKMEIAYTYAVKLKYTDEASEEIKESGKLLPSIPVCLRGIANSSRLFLMAEISAMKGEHDNARKSLEEGLAVSDFHPNSELAYYPQLNRMVCSIMKDWGIKWNNYPLENASVHENVYPLQILLLPKVFGNNFNVSYELVKEMGGFYTPGANSVHSWTFSVETLFHEYAHLWYFHHLNEVSLYKKISWSNPFKFPLSQLNKVVTISHRIDLFDFTKAYSDVRDFASEYGALDVHEDFAEMFSFYLFGAADIRKQIRTELSQGQINLAAKYLYIKYLTPFRGKEFQTVAEPPLTVAEVEKRMNEHRICPSKAVIQVIERSRLAETSEVKPR